MFNRKNKVFCIGLNKTGTTTIEQVLKDWGYRIGYQKAGEMLLNDWGKRDFKKLMLFVKTADAFQDAPFSFPYTFIVLQQKYPNAKFILTIRDSAEQWYNSITKFHSKRWGDDNGIPPTEEQLKNAHYNYKGRPYIANQLLFNTPKGDPYNKEVLISYYNHHIYSVQEYFRHIPDNLITVNVSRQSDYIRLAEFLGKDPMGNEFPWLNKTANDTSN